MTIPFFQTSAFYHQFFSPTTATGPGSGISSNTKGLISSVASAAARAGLPINVGIKGGMGATADFGNVRIYAPGRKPIGLLTNLFESNLTNPILMGRTASLKNFRGIHQLGSTVYLGPGMRVSEGGVVESFSASYQREVSAALASGGIDSIAAINRKLMSTFTNKAQKDVSMLFDTSGPRIIPAIYASHSIDVNNLNVMIGGKSERYGDVAARLRAAELGMSSFKDDKRKLEQLFRERNELIGATSEALRIQGIKFNPLMSREGKFLEGIVSTLSPTDIGFSVTMEGLAKGEVFKRQNIQGMRMDLVEKYFGGAANKEILPAVAGKMFGELTEASTVLGEVLGTAGKRTGSKKSIKTLRNIPEIQVNTFFAIGERAKGASQWSSVGSLGDSSSELSGRLFKAASQSLESTGVYSAAEMGGSAHIKLGAAGIQGAAMPDQLKAVFEAASKRESEVLIGRKKYGITYGAGGRFTLDKELVIRKSKHLGYDQAGNVVPLIKGGKQVNYGVFLGTSAPVEGIPHTVQDIERNRVLVKNARAVSFRGGSILEDGKIGLVVAPQKGYRRTVTSLAGGKATLAVKSSTNMNVGGKAVDLLMRSDDLALKIKGTGLVASEKFVTEHYLRTLATYSRKAGEAQLQELAKTLGIGYQQGKSYAVAGGGPTVRKAFDSYLFRSEMSELSGKNLSEAITRLHSASPADLAKMGLSSKDAKEVLGLLSPSASGGYQIASKHFKILDRGNKELIGVSGLLSSFSIRQISNPKSARPGKLRIRLDNYARHVEQQMTVFGAIGEIGLADDMRKYMDMLLSSKQSGIKSTKILGGALAGKYASGVKPGVVSQVASTLSLLSPGSAMKGILGKMGASQMQTLTVSEMLSDAFERPLAGSQGQAAAMMKGGLNLSNIPGSAYVVKKGVAQTPADLVKNINRGGFMLDLGFDVAVPIGDKEFRTSMVPILTSDVLGTQAQGMSMYMSGGLREADLAMRKELILARIAEEEAIAKAMGKTLKDQISPEAKAMIGSYMSDVYSSMIGKEGLLHTATTVSPKAGLSSMKVTHLPLTDTMDNLLTVKMGEADFFEALKASRGDKFVKQYKKNLKAGKAVEKIFAMAHRDPAHSRGNILPVLLEIDKSMKDRGTVKISNIISRLFGDYDNDSVSLVLASGKSPSELNKAMGRMYDYQLKEAIPFAKITKEMADKEVGNLFGVLKSAGVLNADIGQDDFMARAMKDLGATKIDDKVLEHATKMAMRQRFAGAAGEAVLTKQADKMAKMTADLITAHAGGQGILSQAHRDLLPFIRQEGGQLAVAADIFESFNKNPMANQLLSLAGNIQEGLVYSALKKTERGGLGIVVGEDLIKTFGSAMADYAENKSAANLALVKQTFVEGFTRSFTEGSLAAQAGGQHLVALGIDDAAYKSLLSRGNDALKAEVSGRLSSLFEGTKDMFGAIADITSSAKGYNQGLVSRIISRYRAEGANEAFDAALQSGAVSKALLGQDMAALTDMSIEGQAAAAMKKVNTSNLSAQNAAVNNAAATQGQSTLSRAAGLAQELWGNKGFKQGALVAGGIMGGLAIYDSIFGDDEQPAPPVYSNAGSPLPPAASMQMPDANASIPPPASFPSTPRVERPYSMRQVYNVSGSGADTVDFGGLMAPGAVGTNAIPSRSSYVRDSRERISNRNQPYQLREKLNSSF